jgi:nicotinate-nucleotide pyrophosphorylase (carboxylating)
MNFTAAESNACRRLVAWALDEDLGGLNDVTSEAIIPEDQTGRAALVSRAPGVLAGLPAVPLVVAAVAPDLTFEALTEDGQPLSPGQRIATLSGPLRSLLTMERTALNFLQHLSGIATLTRRFVDAVAGLNCRILDTRKTLPGWRLLAKYAVRCGGGHNHRTGLYDGVLIKDNHLAALAGKPQALTEAIRAARRHASTVPLEVEVDTLEQLDEALAARPDMVLLDNMTLNQLREAVRRRNASASGVLLEASGGVTLETVRAIAETGVDRISVGALTHSAPALDIALDYQP